MFRERFCNVLPKDDLPDSSSCLDKERRKKKNAKGAVRTEAWLSGALFTCFTGTKVQILTRQTWLKALSATLEGPRRIWKISVWWHQTGLVTQHDSEVSSSDDFARVGSLFLSSLSLSLFLSFSLACQT